MKEKIKFNLPQNLKEAKRIQHILKQNVKIVPFTKMIKKVIALDCSYNSGMIYGVGVIWDNNKKSMEKYIVKKSMVTFPYISGFLSFREIPILQKILGEVSDIDLILVDGQGILHPRGLGLASHIGIIYDIPTIGVAKSHLIGNVKKNKKNIGVIGEIYIHNILQGILYSNGYKPLYISPGHLMDIESIKRIIPEFFKGHRLPEPIFLADKISKKVKNEI